ncbi:Vacuolar protein-sorting-associated protein 28 [Physocladia obscura]|uniref:Vacuolar protein-sorting-associated protein 28 n=1 Tax=Physocladia obscura TaxID=109957 RepID=A0AAD5SZ21_9FUNG|nr:Vacuolar protein-sorting-associated protein 28 [Physocladia obscura]
MNKNKIVTVVQNTTKKDAQEDPLLVRLAAVPRIKPLIKDSVPHSPSSSSAGASSWFFFNNNPQSQQSPQIGYSISPEPIEALLTRLKSHTRNVAARVAATQKHIDARIVGTDQYCTQIVSTVSTRLAQARARSSTVAQVATIASISSETNTLIKSLVRTIATLDPYLTPNERLDSAENIERFPRLTKLRTGSSAWQRTEFSDSSRPASSLGTVREDDGGIDFSNRRHTRGDSVGSSGPSSIWAKMAASVNFSPARSAEIPSRKSSKNLSKLEMDTQIKFTQREAENLDATADLFSILVATEALEKAYIRDAVSAADYTTHCTRLIAQFKTARDLLPQGINIDQFMREYKLSCPAATKRLIEIGVPATVEHAVAESAASGRQHIKAVADITTVCPSHRLSIESKLSNVEQNKTTVFYNPYGLHKAEYDGCRPIASASRRSCSRTQQTAWIAKRF